MKLLLNYLRERFFNLSNLISFDLFDIYFYSNYSLLFESFNLSCLIINCFIINDCSLQNNAFRVCSIVVKFPHRFMINSKFGSILFLAHVYVNQFCKVFLVFGCYELYLYFAFLLSQIFKVLVDFLLLWIFYEIILIFNFLIETVFIFCILLLSWIYGPLNLGTRLYCLLLIPKNFL